MNTFHVQLCKELRGNRQTPPTSWEGSLLVASPQNRREGWKWIPASSRGVGSAFPQVDGKVGNDPSHRTKGKSGAAFPHGGMGNCRWISIAFHKPGEITQSFLSACESLFTIYSSMKWDGLLHFDPVKLCMVGLRILILRC